MARFFYGLILLCLSHYLNATQPITPRIACPTPYQPVGDRCYYVEKVEEYNLEGAIQKCSELFGGILIELETRTEIDMIRYYLLDVHGECSNWSKGDFFTGGMERSDGTYSWRSTGTKVQFFDWADPNEPNSPNNDDLITTLCAQKFEWNDLFKEIEDLNIVCEKAPVRIAGNDGEIVVDEETEVDGKSMSPAVICPSQYTPIGDGCYHLDIINSLNWEDSQRFCNGLSNGYLAKLTSRNEIDMIRHYYGYNEQSCPGNAFWIGGYGVAGAKYEWGNGVPINYFAWSAKAPEFQSDIAAIAMNCGRDWDWYDLPRSNIAFFLCEANPTGFQSTTTKM